MSRNAFVPPDAIRAAFSAAMSDMYRRETPMYATLLDIVRDVNEAALEQAPSGSPQVQGDGGVARLEVERHGAIRVGTARELSTLRRLFAVVGMCAVGYYDLSVSGVPVHATCFRPVTPASLARNPFRVFASLLRIDLIEDEQLRDSASELLARREIFTPRAIDLIERGTAQGGLNESDAQDFVAEALETFRWHGKTEVPLGTYVRMRDAHRLLADVVCFKGAHINHLTPCTLDIDAAQAEMQRRGMASKAVIEGPPRRRVPILLRQTSFKALDENVSFAGEVGTHTARFGEIEQRGVALTRKGRALYDALIARVRSAGAGQGGYAERLQEAFEEFPDDLEALRVQGLAFFRYSLTPHVETMRGALADEDLESLVARGLVRFSPITYEDFLPVSAAGIFQSNLGECAQKHYESSPRKAEFEAALGAEVLDEFALYEEEERGSIAAVRHQLAIAAPLASLRLKSGLRDIVGDAGFIEGGHAPAYEKGMRYGDGRAICVVRPANVDDVSKIVALCAAEGVQVVPQGANTGLVGASTPDQSGSQVVLSLDRFRSKCEVDPVNRTVTADAGMLLHEVNDALAPHGLWFPVDLGADPSVGGMVAANTGGTRLIRYGDVRRNLLALEVVLFDPPGEIVQLGRPLFKDNSGLDLKQLFVGASGALGVIARATFEVRIRPKQAATALVVPADDAAVVTLMGELERELGDFLSAYEGISNTALRAAFEHSPSVRDPFAGQPLPDFVVLIELEAGSSPAATRLNLEEVLGEFLERRFGETVVNAVMGKGAELWNLRHAISEGARHIGTSIAFDISVPRSRIMAFRRAAIHLVRSRWPHLHIVDFGHIADGGLHFNLAWPASEARPYDGRTVRDARDSIYQLAVHEFEGSFSAEHGVGPHNAAYYRAFTPPAALRLAGRVQQAMDPLRMGGRVDFSACNSERQR